MFTRLKKGSSQVKSQYVVYDRNPAKRDNKTSAPLTALGQGPSFINEGDYFFEKKPTSFMANSTLFVNSWWCDEKVEAY